MDQINEIDTVSRSSSCICLLPLSILIALLTPSNVQPNRLSLSKTIPPLTPAPLPYLPAGSPLRRQQRVQPTADRFRLGDVPGLRAGGERRRRSDGEEFYASRGAAGDGGVYFVIDRRDGI